MKIRAKIEPVILRYNGEFTSTRLAELTGLTQKQIRPVLRQLWHEGIIEWYGFNVGVRNSNLNSWKTVKSKNVLAHYTTEELLLELKRRIK